MVRHVSATTVLADVQAVVKRVRDKWLSSDASRAARLVWKMRQVRRGDYQDKADDINGGVRWLANALADDVKIASVAGLRTSSQTVRELALGLVSTDGSRLSVTLEPVLSHAFLLNGRVDGKVKVMSLFQMLLLSCLSDQCELCIRQCLLQLDTMVEQRAVTGADDAWLYLTCFRNCAVACAAACQAGYDDNRNSKTVPNHALLPSPLLFLKQAVVRVSMFFKATGACPVGLSPAINKQVLHLTDGTDCLLASRKRPLLV